MYRNLQSPLIGCIFCDGVEVSAKTFKFEFLQLLLLEVAVSQLLSPHNSQFEKHLARGHVHSGMYIHFTRFVLLTFTVMLLFVLQE